MKNKALKFIFISLFVLLVIGLSACGSENNGKEKPNQNSGTNVVDYEACFRWDGDSITGLSSLGRAQKKLVIPAHCQAITGALNSGNEEILEEVVFEGGYDIDIGASFSLLAKLRSIQLPEELTVIPEVAFMDCLSLREIVIPGNVVIIEKYAFENVPLESIEIQGQSLKEIGDKAFYQCPITSLVLPDSVEVIRKSAFEECESLTTLTLPKSLRVVEAQAFMNTGLTDIYVPAEVEIETVGISAFNRNAYVITVHVVKGSWMDENFDTVFDHTFEKTYQ